MTAYYNEIDPYAAQWLRNLIAEGLIADGDVDERSIVDVQADDVAGYGQCHFFAGIGGWSYALRLAGWPDDKPVWTGSCPCQPFSVAGKRKGTDDARHLWPEFRRLIEKRSPPVVFGEQVASKDGRDWLASVRAEMEALGYAVGGADICAAGIGAPHIRQRLWFVGVADADYTRLEGRGQMRERADELSFGPNGLASRMANTDGNGSCRGRVSRQKQSSGENNGASLERSERFCEDGGESQNNVEWGVADWLKCTDRKWRPVEPGSFPLAHGIPGRVGMLRAYGNSIVPQVAAEFIAATGLVE